MEHPGESYKFGESKVALEAVDDSVKSLPHQLAMVGSWPTMVITGNGGSGFDSGEGA